MKKTYSNASNARRAAKAAGLVAARIYKVSDGCFKIRAETVTAAPAPKAPKKVAARKAPAKAKAVKGETKSAQLIKLVSRGATTAELMETLGWLPHTVRAALSRLGTAGYAVTRTKVGNADDGFESHYKIAS